MADDRDLARWRVYVHCPSLAAFGHCGLPAATSTIIPIWQGRRSRPGRGVRRASRSGSIRSSYHVVGTFRATAEPREHQTWLSLTRAAFARVERNWPNRRYRAGISRVAREPALIVGGGRTLAANAAARALLGESIVDRDVRIAIRHPQALQSVLAGKRADVAVIGLGSAERPWQLSVRPFGRDSVLIRLIDRSATIAAERMRVDFVANATRIAHPLATIPALPKPARTALDEQTTPSRATIHTEAARMRASSRT